VLAARDPRTKKSASMNPLEGTSEEDLAIIKKGERKFRIEFDSLYQNYFQ
jgi:hypothetical protein